MLSKAELIALGIVGGGGVSYKQSVISSLGAKLLGYWPMNDASGVTAKAAVGTDGTYNGTVNLGQTGIGDGLTSALMANGVATGLNTSAAAIDFNEGFVSFWMAATNGATYADGATYYFLAQSFDATHQIVGSKDGAGKLRFYRRDNVSATQYHYWGAPSTNRLVHYCFAWSVANQKIWLYINGAKSVPLSKAMTAMTNTLDATLSTFGAKGTAATDGWASRYAHAILGTGLPTDAQALLMGRTTKTIAFEGDSRSILATLWATSAVDVAFTSGSIAYGGYGVANWAITGNTMDSNATTGITAQAPTGVDTIANKNILVIWGGVNNPAIGAAALYANIKTEVAARRAAGWQKIILCTEIDAQSAYHNAQGWHTTIYPDLNTLIRGDNSFVDAVIDLGADARLQDATNTTYFNADKVHLVAAGYAVVAELAAPVIATQA